MSPMKRLLVALVCACLSPTGATGAGLDPPAEPVPEAVKSITAKEIGGHLRFLASDLMKGRDTASPEARVAAEYLAAHLFAAGAEPLGDNGRPWPHLLPELPARGRHAAGGRDRARPDPRIQRLEAGDPLQARQRVHPRTRTASSPARSRHRSSSPVTAGSIPSKKIDDYEGLDVKNQFVLVYDGQPDDAEGQQGTERPVPFFNPFAKSCRGAEERGARRADDPAPGPPVAGSAGPVQRCATSASRRPSMTLGPAPTEPAHAQPVRPDPRCSRRRPWPRRRQQAARASAAGASRVRFRYAARKESKSDRNVSASSPAPTRRRRRRSIIFSAHYDHVGVNDKGEIFNGSDDNASGTSSLLEIAEAFGQGPTAGAERGVPVGLGRGEGAPGQPLVRRPLEACPPMHKIVADINLDMVSRNDPKTDRHHPVAQARRVQLAHPRRAGLVQGRGHGGRLRRRRVLSSAPTATASPARASPSSSSSRAFTPTTTGRPTISRRPTWRRPPASPVSAYRLGWQVAQGREAPKKIKAESSEKADQAVTSK